MGGGRRSARGRSFAVLPALPLVTAGLAAVPPVGAAGGDGSPFPLELVRPRVLGAGANLAAVAARLTREPYRTVFLRLVANARASNRVTLDDHTIASERIKAKDRPRVGRAGIV